MRVGVVDPVAGLRASQHQMLATLGEIERQANVGIGYAFSAEHIMSDNLICDAISKAAS
jgi:hypothetical protein